MSEMAHDWDAVQVRHLDAHLRHHRPDGREAVLSVDADGILVWTTRAATGGQVMLQGKIEFTGATLSDVREAVMEALGRMTAAPAVGAERGSGMTFTYVVEEASGDELSPSAPVSEEEDLRRGMASFADYDRRKREGTMVPGVPHDEVRRRLGLV